MKAKWIVGGLALFVCASASFACDDNTQRTAADEEIVLTGTYIKSHVKRYGFLTTGPDQLLIVDRQAIERSGAADVRQLLNRYGLSR